MKLYLSFFSLIFLLFCAACNTQVVSDDKTPSHDSDTTPIPERAKTIKGVRPVEGGKDMPDVQRVGFYNVENLFDTQNAPKKADDDFTPTGKYKWQKKMYQKKLKHIAKVIDYMGQPGLMGLCEVENKDVLEDLVREKSLEDAHYSIVHHESPDHRGIDVALLYSKDEYTRKGEEIIRIRFPKNIVKGYTTRDILHVTLQNKKKEYFHVFVNHWPSRRGGVKESEPKRLYVAEQLRKAVDDIFEKYENNHIIIMGDLNDGCENKSVRKVLGALPVSNSPKAEQLYDLTDALYKKGMGTHNYGGEWNMLDHLIVSGSLLDKKGTDLRKAKVFNRKWMLFYHKKSRQHRPNRTFSGGRYHGGYSDHLPISAEFVEY